MDNHCLLVWSLSLALRRDASYMESMHHLSRGGKGEGAGESESESQRPILELGLSNL